MSVKLSLKIMLAVLTLSTSACSKESPELVPCMCDGSESTLGLFDCMCEPMKKRPVKRLSYIRNRAPIQTLYIDQEKRDAYFYLHQRRDSFAPIQLSHVDFRIKKGRKYDQFDTKLGNYRFRIFGCRRENKNVFLNKGRAMQKDMHFFEIFYEQMNEYYPVVVDKGNPYYMESDKIATPEYLVSAEITDYFMNICDEFDWNNVKQKKLRSGTSEMTVTWRVMNITRDEVYCKGTTTGYGQISEGEPNGETLLVERAFEDALNKLPEIDCFNQTIAQRIHPDDLARQLAEIEDMECKNASIKNQYARELKGIDVLQNCATGVPTDMEAVKSDFFTEGDSCEGANLVKGTYVDGIFVEDDNGMVGGHYVDGVFVEDCKEPCPPIVRGRYENGKFVEDAGGSVFGRYVDGKFVEEKVLPGKVVRGYYNLDGKFVEDENGDVYGYYDSNGNFVAELDENECDNLYGIEERHGFNESFSRIDSSSGVRGEGFDNITPLQVQEECVSIPVQEYFEGIECAAPTTSGTEEIVIETTETCYTPCTEPLPQIFEDGGVSGAGSYSNFSYIDSQGECQAAGIIIDENGDLVSGAAACDGVGVSEEKKVPCVVKAPCKVKKKPCVIKAPCLTPGDKNDCTESELEFANAVLEASGAFSKVLNLEQCQQFLEGKGLYQSYQMTMEEKARMTVLCQEALADKLPEITRYANNSEKAVDEALNTVECRDIAQKYAQSASSLTDKAQILDVCRQAASDKALRTGCKALIIAQERGGISASKGMADKAQFTPMPKEQKVLLDSECRALEIQDNNRTIVQPEEGITHIRDDYLLEVPANVKDKSVLEDRKLIENSFANANNSFCIQNNPPYDNLNPQNMYKVRASVVSVENVNGKKGAGLIIADNLILTSADLMVKDNNNFVIKTINGRTYYANALRINPNKNVALLMLEQKVKYSPLPMSLELPEVDSVLITLGLMDFDEGGEGYLDNKGKVVGYRWSEDKSAEIIVDTYVQSVTIGGALIDANGNIVGIAHESRKLDDSKDIFIPIETALKALGLEICGQKTGGRKPVAFKIIQTPLADAIDASRGSKAPKPMGKKGRK